MLIWNSTEVVCGGVDILYLKIMERSKPNLPFQVPVDIASIIRATGCSESEIMRIYNFIQQKHHLLPRSSEVKTNTSECEDELVENLATILCLNPSTLGQNALFGCKTMELWQKSEVLQRYAVYRVLHQLLHNNEISSNNYECSESAQCILGQLTACHIIEAQSDVHDNRESPSNISYSSNTTSSESRMKSVGTLDYSWSSKPARKVKWCSFCRANNERTDVYTSHVLYDKETNILQCPILRKLVCPLCGSTGDNAHTLTYCPLKKTSAGTKPASVFYHINKSYRLASGKPRAY